MTREQAAAVAYAERGWYVFPVCRDKRPLTANGFKDASGDVDRVRAWWLAHPSAGIGWALPRGLFVLDVDAGHGGHETLRQLQARRGQLPMTLNQATGGGGWHLVFRVPEGVEVRQTAGELGPGLDTRVGGKGYVVLPPSVHASGQRYKWRARVPIADGPAWLVRLLAVRQPEVRPHAEPHTIAPVVRIADRYAASVLAGEAMEVSRAVEGTRNRRLYRAWCRCTKDVGVAEHLPREQVRVALGRAAAIAGLPDWEIARTLRDEVAA